MHFLPLPLCGLYSTVRRMVMHRSSLWNRPVDPSSTQWNHRPTSSMRNKHRTRERPTLKLVKLGINNDIVDLIQTPDILLQMEYCTRAPNERVWRITQLAKLSLNHLSVVLTADVFLFLIKSTSPWSRPHEVAQVTRNFGSVSTAIYSYVVPVANLRLFEWETKLWGITLQYSTKCSHSFEVTTVVRLISVFVVNNLLKIVIVYIEM